MRDDKVCLPGGFQGVEEWVRDTRDGEGYTGYDGGFEKIPAIHGVSFSIVLLATDIITYCYFYLSDNFPDLQEGCPVMAFH